MKYNARYTIKSLLVCTVVLSLLLALLRQRIEYSENLKKTETSLLPIRDLVTVTTLGKTAQLVFVGRGQTAKLQIYSFDKNQGERNAVLASEITLPEGVHAVSSYLDLSVGTFGVCAGDSHIALTVPRNVRDVGPFSGGGDHRLGENIVLRDLASADFIDNVQLRINWTRRCH